jgi:protein-S-isoprenylcysteine O-methyltransferase Ste14
MLMSNIQARLNPKTSFPPTYLLVALVLMVTLHWITPLGSVLPAPWNLSGILLVVVGIWISYAAEAQFRRLKTTVKPFENPTTLVTDGMFRFSRNPMCLGFAGILAGVAVMLGSLPSFLVVPVFIVLIDIKFIRVEERPSNTLKVF